MISDTPSFLDVNNLIQKGAGATNVQVTLDAPIPDVEGVF